MRGLPDPIGIIGPGRMGQGIALAFAMAGCRVMLLDLKPRTHQQFAAVQQQFMVDFSRETQLLSYLGLVSSAEAATMADRVTIQPPDQAADIPPLALYFEAVPEVREIKEDCFRWLSKWVDPDAIIASTTSTFLVDELSQSVQNPSRFVNAHWLNPAHLMPLVEVSTGETTSEDTVERLVAWLRAIGKVPVCMKASPGYIVPRIQALAMNEAARLVEEGVASAADVDEAVRVGFGLRFAVLGLTEFIDWGGGDILYYADKYLSETIDSERFKAPDIIDQNMRENRRGLRDGDGFYDYASRDIDDYRRQRLTELVGMLRHLKLLPKTGDAGR